MTGGFTRTASVAATAVVVGCLLWPNGPAHAQGGLDRRIRQNQARLDSIRGERQSLQDELQLLRGRARNLSSEIRNIERQKSLTTRVVNELDRQMAFMATQLDTVTMDLMLTQDALAETQAVLQRRLAQIYKRGSLWPFQVLLAAESFGDLLSRYKYLHLISRQDRALVHEMEELADRIAVRRREQLSVQTAVSNQRTQRSQELQRYVRLERQRQNTLRRTEASRRAATSRLDSLARAEEDLNTVIAALESERRRAIASGARTDAEGSISTADLGTLEWPIEGETIYTFGRGPGPDGTHIRRNGIGIAAAVGTPVRAVASGTVQVAAGMGTYGPTILIEHGAGFYTLYLYLSRFDVRPGQVVQAGQVIGRSGGDRSDVGPHLEFQIRGQGGIALDPNSWLRIRR